MARLRLFGLVLLVMAGQLGACARTGPPAPVVRHGSERYDRSTAASASLNQARETEPGVAVVQPGDTLFGLARRHNIPIRAVIDANGLQPPYVLQPGQRLTLPRVRTHVVQTGDTVYGISRRYGVDMSALVRANDIQPPYPIVIGQTLILPERTAAPTETAQASAPAPASPAPMVASPAPAPTPGSRSVESAALPPPPAAAPAPTPSPTSSAPVATPVPEPPQQHAATPVPAAPTARPTVQEAAPVAAPGQPQPEPALPEREADLAQADISPAQVPARGGRAFLWPLRGTIVSDFGPKGGGLHNDGINIAAPKGTPIHAAENGVVVYAGNELRGFGNLLLLRHADGWLTAYAHTDEILVSRGDQVKRGQVIARVGMTGNVTTPQIHFEIRRGKRAVNPHDYLVAQSASN